MKNIKILILVIIIMLSNFFDVFAKSVNELNKEKKELQNQISDVKESLTETKQQKSTVLKQVESLDSELEKVQVGLSNLEKQLGDTIDNLKKTEENLLIATEKKENQYSSLKKRLRVIYQGGNFGYVEILFGSANFSDFIRRIEYINTIAKYDQDILKNYRETEMTIEEQVNSIKIQKDQLEKLSSEHKTKKANLQESIKAKEDLVKKFESEEATFQEQMKILENESKQIQSMIRAATAVKVTGSSNNKIYATTGGSMQYPVPAYIGYEYNSTYGSRVHPIKKRKIFHTGLDLKATLNTDIVAARDGVVISAKNMSGYGKTVVIDHGGGISTLYAHNNALVVSVGQRVKRGQVIAKAGTTGLSTGVHCHFEVRINGEHTNPAPYIGR